VTALAFAAAALAGGVAAVVRYLITLAFATRAVPWAVLAVNVIASAVGGGVVGLVDAGGADAAVRLVVLGGVAGGLSTFSTWSVETVQLARSGRWRVAALSVVGNLVLGLAAAATGYSLAG